jgi:ligand-binding sensor protein
MQDVFAEMGGIGALTTDTEGVPLTEISNCSPFCRLIVDSEKGYAACLDSWKTIARQTEDQPRFLTCHAGLQYARAYIHLNDKNEAMLVGGQFYTIPPAAQEAEKNTRRLAKKYDIDPVSLLDASHHIPFLDARKKREITNWYTKVANTFSQISQERFDLIHRLKRISKMSSFDLG